MCSSDSMNFVVFTDETLSSGNFLYFENQSFVKLNLRMHFYITIKQIANKCLNTCHEDVGGTQNGSVL